MSRERNPRVRQLIRRLRTAGKELVKKGLVTDYRVSAVGNRIDVMFVPKVAPKYLDVDIVIVDDATTTNGIIE